MLGHNRPPVDDILEDCNDQRSGWIAISREIRDHWLVGYGKAVTPADPTRGSYSQHEAFQDLLMECRYRKGYVVNGGRKMQISPGQVIGAISWLAARWNWTPKKVRWFLDQLVEDNMITRHLVDKSGNFVEPQRGNRYGNQSTIITVCNYTKYQSVGGWQRQSTRQSEGNQGAIEGQSRGNQAVVTHCFESEKTPLTKEQGNKGTISQPEGAVPEKLAGEDLASQMAKDVAGWMSGGDEQLAREWLRNTRSAYGNDNLRDAWIKLKSDLAEGKIIAHKLGTLSAIAKRLKEDPAAVATSRSKIDKLKANLTAEQRALVEARNAGR